jgi:carbamoyl-phosphate synthase small subunit
MLCAENGTSTIARGSNAMVTKNTLNQGRQPAKLILEDGSIFPGFSFGAQKPKAGEVVFNTGMVGYPESLTDPSYWGQILVLTYPLIGNYGIPGYDEEEKLLKYFEADRIQVQGLIISNYSDRYSHWNAKKSLSEWLIEQNIPGICDIDTRELTKKLRHQGTMLGKIVLENNNMNEKNSTNPGINNKKHLKLQDPNKRHLAAEVSITEPVIYKKGKKKVAIIDLGVKNNIIRAFLRRGITVIRCPCNFNFLEDKLTKDVDGIVLSNGPGDPKSCKDTVKNVKSALNNTTPILGICLGSQILGLAAGANTYKLKYGHRSHNQPCIEMGTKRCYITTQNHGYAIDSNTLPEDWREWFYNNNDDTNEGIIHISKPFFGAQFHPEASPGPDDTEFIFDMFLRSMR